MRKKNILIILVFLFILVSFFYSCLPSDPPPYELRVIINDPNLLTAKYLSITDSAYIPASDKRRYTYKITEKCNEYIFYEFIEPLQIIVQFEDTTKSLKSALIKTIYGENVLLISASHDLKSIEATRVEENINPKPNSCTNSYNFYDFELKKISKCYAPLSKLLNLKYSLNISYQGYHAARWLYENYKGALIHDDFYEVNIPDRNRNDLKLTVKLSSIDSTNTLLEVTKVQSISFWSKTNLTSMRKTDSIMQIPEITLINYIDSTILYKMKDKIKKINN